MKEFDFNKAKEGHPLVTRNGRKARVICFDAKNEKYPIIALITESDEKEYPYSFNKNGSMYCNGIHESDLFMAPEIHTGWINIDVRIGKTREGSAIYDTKEEALKYALPTTVATIKVDWEE